MGLDPFGVHGVHNGFGSWSDNEFFFEFFPASVGDDSEFWREAFDVAGFLFEETFGDEEGKVGVFDAHFFKALVHIVLNFFPNAVGEWAVDDAAFDGRVVDHAGLC